MVSTITSYMNIANNLPRSLDLIAKQPETSRETDYYLKNIGNVKTIDDFINNTRLFTYAMKAFGLSDMTYAKAYMRKVLTEGVASKDSFANKLSDPRFKDFATTFNFAGMGDLATTTTAAQSGTVNKYMQTTLEENAGEQNEGVRLALYFQRKAPSITNSLQILADPGLLKTVQTALGISPNTSMAPVDQQAAMLTKRIDFADFQDPAKLQQFIQRFTALWDSDNGPPADAMPPLVIGQPLEMGISADTLASLQSLKIGG